jgi:hypothetical protein
MADAINQLESLGMRPAAKELPVHVKKEVQKAQNKRKATNDSRARQKNSMEPLHAMYIIVLSIARGSLGKQLDYKATDKREHIDYDQHTTRLKQGAREKKQRGSPPGQIENDWTLLIH